MGALLFFLALAVPRVDSAQNGTIIARTPQPQSNPAPLPKISAPGNAKETTGGKVAEKSGIAAITDISVASEDAKLTITVATDRPIEPQELILQNPPRIVLDFPNAQNKVAFTKLPVNAAFIKRVRVQQFQSMPSPIVRVVLDLEEGYGKFEINSDKESVRLVFSRSKSASSTSASAAIPTPAPADLSKPKASDASTSVKPAAVAVTKPVAPAEPVAKSSAPAVVSRPKASEASTSVKPAAAAATKPVAPAEPVAKSSAPAAPAPAPAVVSKPKVSEAGKTVSATETKPAIAPESVAKSAASTAALDKPSPQPDSSKTVKSSAAKVRPAETVAKATEAPAKPQSAAAPAVEASRPKSSQSPATPSEMKPPISRPELPKSALVMSSRSVPPEPPVQAPAAAARTQSSMAPTRAVVTGSTRFSGQPLTLDLVDIPLVDFFRLMSEEGGINIVMDPEIKARVSIKVVKVPWDQIFESVMTNNSLDKQVEGSVVRIAKKSTLQEEARQQESLKKANLLAADVETRIKRLNYTKGASLLKALEDQKTVRGTIVVEERTNSLILTDLPSSINKLIPLIETLDIPQPQVEIEARIVSATRDFARDIGIQFGFVDGNLQRVTVGGPNTFGTIGGTRPSATPKNTFIAGNSSTGRGASESSTTDSAAVSTGTQSNDKGNYNVNLPATKAFGGLGISIGNIFDTFLLDAAITAGESKGLAKLISQPKVTAQNNSAAVITQGLRFPVQIVANNTVTVQFQNAALTLTVTPQITVEGNIVLDLKVENNTPDFGRQVNGIPSIRTSESTTRVLVSDGGTTVIGGILIDNETTQEDKVPGLGSLPLVGNLFRRSSVSRSTQEVLFFVTPRIIK